MKTLVRMKFGSHLYGTSTPASDLDFKNVFVPSANDILLQRVKHTVTSKRAKSDGEKNFAGELDEEGYALHRFMQLIAEGQTVSLDMLFANESAILTTSDCWSEVVANRHRLLTKKSAAFVGYCRTQANKYGIRGSRVASVKAAAEMFKNELAARGALAKLSEIENELIVFATANEHCAMISIANANLGMSMLHFECCNKKIPITNSIKSAADLYARIYDDYGHRARKAALNEGIDWKALSHAVRVAREAVELLTTGHITFPLTYAEHILKIKRGSLSYDVVAAEIEELLGDVESAAEKSSLPDRPDLVFMDDLTRMAYAQAVKENVT